MRLTRQRVTRQRVTRHLGRVGARWRHKVPRALSERYGRVAPPERYTTFCSSGPALGLSYAGSSRACHE